MSSRVTPEHGVSRPLEKWLIDVEGGSTSDWKPTGLLAPFPKSILGGAHSSSSPSASSMLVSISRSSSVRT